MKNKQDFQNSDLYESRYHIQERRSTARFFFTIVVLVWSIMVALTCWRSMFGGFLQFINCLDGVSDEMRRTEMSTLLNAKLSDVIAAGKEICQNAQDSKSAIIFSKTEENAGKIVDLHL